jgi:predicted amidohydrolase YtcJ
MIWRKSFVLVMLVAVGAFAMACSQSMPVEVADPADVEKTAAPNEEETIEPAELVLRGGKIATVDEDFSLQEAVAVHEGAIVYVGDNAGVEEYIGPKTKVIELKGALALPGLVDAHGHMHSLGAELANLDISGAKDYRGIVELVAQRVYQSKPGEWIIGGRWNHEEWEVKEFPIHDLLSAVSLDNPVYLRRVDGNSAFVNAKALELAGYTADTPDPEGGKIIRKENGAPTGVLVNRAMNPVLELIPPLTDEEQKRQFIMAMESCVAVGLTGMHEAGVGPRELALYKKMIDSGELKMRLNAMLGEQERPQYADDFDMAAYFKKHRVINYGGNEMLTVRSIKLFFDGALGSRGAAFYEDYADAPGELGLLRIPPEYITRVAKAALEADMLVATHCIGIRGNRLCIDAYEKALLENPKEDHRFRVEHAQIVRDEDIAKFAKLGIVPSMQPTHCTSDMSFVAKRVGDERAAGAYAWRKFMDTGLVIPCGSDFPVESNNPMLGIYAAITRQDAKGQPKGGWFSKQRMTREEAIRGFTNWAAYASFQENVLGSIEVGKLADFTVLDKDILEVQPQEILTAKALYTIVGGDIVYQAKR